MNTFLNILGIVIDPFAAVCLTYILFFHSARRKISVGYRIAIVLAICGLIGQVAWSVQVLLYPHSLATTSLPWWIGKDLGYFVFGLTSLWHYQETRNLLKGK